MLVISGTIPLDVRAKMRPSKSCSGQMIEAESTLTCSLPVVQMIPHNSLPSGAVSARGADVISLFSLEMLGYESLQAAEPARFGGGDLVFDLSVDHHHQEHLLRLFSLSEKLAFLQVLKQSTHLGNAGKQIMLKVIFHSQVFLIGPFSSSQHRKGGW